MAGVTKTETFKATQGERTPLYFGEAKYTMLTCPNSSTDKKDLKKKKLYHIMDYLNVIEASIFLTL